MTARDRRALRWGIVAVAAAVALRALPPALRRLGEARERLAERTATLERARELVAAAPATRDSLAGVVGGVVALAPALLDGGTEAEAAASLASAVGLAAERNALRVVRLDPAGDSAGGPIRPVRLRAELEGDVAGLTGFLRAVETGRPLLTVGALDVVAPDPVPRPGAPEVLRIQAEVGGWYLPREAR